MSKKLKDAVEKFVKLDPKAAERICLVNTHPEVVAMNEKISRFENKLLEIKQTLQDLYEGVQQSGSRYSTDEDVKMLLSDTPPEQLPGMVYDTTKQNLWRQRLGIEKALEVLQQQRRELYHRVAIQGCEKFVDINKKYLGNLLDGYELLKRKIVELKTFYDFLTVMGYPSEHRLDGWQTWPIDEQFLTGGPMVKQVDWMIETRRKALGK
jgi:hypothetical protein